jgi:hypothetical protein
MVEYNLVFSGVNASSGPTVIPLGPSTPGDTMLNAVVIAAGSTTTVGQDVTSAFGGVPVTHIINALNISVNGISNTTFNVLVQQAGSNLLGATILALMQH